MGKLHQSIWRIYILLRTIKIYRTICRA